jgi:predicted SnoaL-like aldol condensation-catalyzing enzyme
VLESLFSNFTVDGRNLRITRFVGTTARRLMATEELKDMLQYGHLELADKIMDAGYIQHNHNVPRGRGGFKQSMSPGARANTAGVQAPEWKSAPVLILADRPYVVTMWDRKDNHPADPAKEYTWNHLMCFALRMAW